VWHTVSFARSDPVYVLTDNDGSQIWHAFLQGSSGIRLSLCNIVAGIVRRWLLVWVTLAYNSNSRVSSLSRLFSGWGMARQPHGKIVFGAFLLYFFFDLSSTLCSYPHNLCAVNLLFFHVVKVRFLRSHCCKHLAFA